MRENETLAQVPPKTGGLTSMTGAMALIIVLLVIQIWLLSAALESFLAGRREAALPAAIFSGILFVICFALYIFVDRIDAESRHPRASSAGNAVDMSSQTVGPELTNHDPSHARE